MRVLVFLSFAISFLLFTGCDKVDNPIIDLGPDANLDTTVVYTSYEDNSSNRIAILMDFTGHNCPNCPGAARTAKNIEDNYEGNVHILGVHPIAPGLTEPVEAHPEGGFQTNWITPEGESIQDAYGIPTALPIGMVSGLETQGPGIFHLFPGGWQTKVEEAIAAPSFMNIDLEKGFSEANRSFVVDATITLNANISSDLALIIVLAENNLVDWQVNGTETFPSDPAYDGGEIDDYVHNHVLRKHLNGLQGADISLEPVSVGDTLQYNHSGVISEDYVAENCDLLVYIYDKTTLEIYHCVKAHLID